MGREYVVYQYDKTRRPKEKNIEIEGLVCSTKKFRIEKILRFRILMFAFVSQGRYRIFCVDDDNGLVHYTFYMPYCRKFSFMGREDFQIGPSWTREDWRGKGVFGKVLICVSEHILEKRGNANIYALVREENQSSTKGMKKANFKRVGKCKKTKYLKHYKKLIMD